MIKRFLRLVMTAIPLFLFVSGTDAQPVAQRIAAVVNNDIISSRDLANRIGLAILASGLPDGQDTRDRIAPQVLRGLIDERLQLQAATRLRLEVTKAEIDKAFVDVAQRNRMSPDQLALFLTGKGIEPTLVRDQLRAQIAWLKVISRELRSRVVVTRDQIELAMRTGQAADEELLLSEILLPVYEAGQEAQTMAEAADLVRSIRGGASFAAVARELSGASSAEGGGDIGWVRLSVIAPELRSVLARLTPGQISEPIRTPAGVQLVEVRERRPVQQRADGTASDAERDRVRQQLQDEQLQRLAARYLRDLRRNAFIDIRT